MSPHRVFAAGAPDSVRRSRARARARSSADSEGLGHEVVGAGVEQADLFPLLVLDGQDEDGGRLVAPPDLLDELEAAEVGHCEVGDDEVEVLFPEPLEGFAAVDHGG